MKLMVVAPNGKKKVIDFTEFLRTHGALTQFCEAHKDGQGSYDHDAAQGSFQDDAAASADYVAEQLQALVLTVEGDQPDGEEGP
jgi:hypothetical protein